MQANAKINLDFAARVIHGIGLPEAIMKTRIRRLYDIANILQSLKLIKKVTITEAHGGRKPAFTYTGPDLSGIGRLSKQTPTPNPNPKNDRNKKLIHPGNAEFNQE